MVASDGRGRVCRGPVAVEGPGGGGGGEGGVVVPPVELALDGVGVLADLEQAQGQAAGSALGLLEAVVDQFVFLPVGVGSARGLGEAGHLAPVERGEAAAHVEAVVADGAGQAEADGALDGPVQGQCRPSGAPRPRDRAVGAQVEVEAVGLPVQPVGDQAQEPRGDGPRIPSQNCST